MRYRHRRQVQTFEMTCVYLTRRQDVSWLQIAELEAPLPPLVAFPPTTSLSEAMPCAGSPAYYGVFGQLP